DRSEEQTPEESISTPDTPESEVDNVDSRSPNPSTNRSTDLPAFAPGTQRRAIEFALGEPTRASSGLWNTRAVLYEDRIPGRADLGYLFDPGSGRLRQTEATFDPSLEIETLSVMLEGMTSNNLSTKIEKGLTAVYRGKVDRFDFVSGRRDRLKGTIQRDEDDRIYIAVWEADLHE
ncbi:serine/threonine protein kinase, partial [Oscillatoriales cyanobacterium LEGE 11467]|nr:serine/threonine protein kinase [Zarconia navalis LEGE 11467]